MKSTRAIDELDKMTEKLLESNKKTLDKAADWTCKSTNVKRITVDGRDAVLIG